MAKSLVIVPCGYSKIWSKEPERGPTMAQDVYIGAPFKVNRAYAEQFADRWVILSAKYGFMDPLMVIPRTYNVTFNDPVTNPVTVATLRQQKQAQSLDQFDIVIGLGGKHYRDVIEAVFAGVSRVQFPFAGLPIGKAMQAVKAATNRNEVLPS